MPRNLRDDYRMYYNGTWVVREHNGQLECKLVEEVGYRRNGYEPVDMEIHGPCYFVDANGRVDYTEDHREGRGLWTGDQIMRWMPESGYYKINDKAPVYLEFQVQNRTNKKGFDGARILHDGAQLRLSSSQTAKLLLAPDFKGKVFNDTCIHQGKIHWRGLEVGSYENGVLTLAEAYNYLQDHLGKQIEMYRHRGE